MGDIDGDRLAGRLDVDGVALLVGVDGGLRGVTSSPGMAYLNFLSQGTV